MPLELNRTTTADAGSARRRFRLPAIGRRALGAADRMAFTEQLAMLLETGMSLTESLQGLRRQAGNPAMVAMLDSLLAEVGAGRQLSHALAMHPQLFSSTYVNLVAASEGGGFMHAVLNQLLAEEQRRAELRRTLVTALSYPGFLAVFSVLTVVFVLVVVFPKFSVLFVRIQDQLPATTRGLMLLSDVLRLYWWQWLLGASAVIFLAARWVGSAAGTETLDRLKLSLPVARDIFVQLYVSQSLRVMSMSLSHGVPIMATLEACKDVVRNGPFRRLLSAVEARVNEGGSLSGAFTDSPFIPTLVKQMIVTGEASGRLAMVMGRIADHYERDLSRRVVALGKMAEPVMLLVMGLVVGIIVSSLVLPIFKLSRAVT